MERQPVYYADYLQLGNILQAQELESAKYGKPAHDEMLFIIVHQTYELWFKQILFEMGSILEIFQEKPLKSLRLQAMVSRFERINEILKVLVEQVRIVESITPLDFLEFRDYLVPASGFQSLQFRLLEARLGIGERDRLQVEKMFFNSRLKPEDFEQFKQAQALPTLLGSLDEWLSRFPFAKSREFDFWQEYKSIIYAFLNRDEETIRSNPTLNEEQKAFELANIQNTRQSYEAILDASLYEKLRNEGQFRLSFEAMRSAIFISLYRDYPMLQLPFRLLSAIIEMDELLTTWRYRHAEMAHRMLGSKIGTGGSSGHHYLKKTAETHRIFSDLFNISTFLIPKSRLPELPDEITLQIDFLYDKL